MGQGSEDSDQVLHDRLGLPVFVAPEYSEPAHPFDQQGDVHGAVSLQELDQVTFPVTELLAPGHGLGAVQNAEFRAKSATVLPSAVTGPTAGTPLGKIAPELDVLASRE